MLTGISLQVDGESGRVIEPLGDRVTWTSGDRVIERLEI